MLGSLAFMLIRGAGYVEALLATLPADGDNAAATRLGVEPAPGFGGVGAFFSRYLLSVGLPFEQWLHRLTVVAEAERDLAAFLGRVLEQMRAALGRGAGTGAQGRAGQLRTRRQLLPGNSLCVRCTCSYTRHRLEPGAGLALPAVDRGWWLNTTRPSCVNASWSR